MLLHHCDPYILLKKRATFFISILLFIFARVYITERHKKTASDVTKT